MADIRHLSRAPISEAMIDFRVLPREGFKPEAFSDLKSELRSLFTQVEERRLVRAVFQIQATGPVAPETQEVGLQGLFFKSADGLNIAQFRLDGFTYNRLAPYTRWDAVLPAVLDLWRRYQSIAEPILVSRLAVRYINHLNLPLPIEDFNRYLTAPPEVPPGAPPFMSSFLARLVFEDPATGITTNLVQALEPSVEPSAVTVLIDIDAYKVQEQGFRSEQVQPTLEALRDTKNRIFFGSITEETARRYE